MEHIRAFTDKPHAREDLALACRQVILSLPWGRPLHMASFRNLHIDVVLSCVMQVLMPRSTLAALLAVAHGARAEHIETDLTINPQHAVQYKGAAAVCDSAAGGHERHRQEHAGGPAGSAPGRQHGAVHRLRAPHAAQLHPAGLQPRPLGFHLRGEDAPPDTLTGLGQSYFHSLSQ